MIVWVDIETSGLDIDKHEITEIAYATESGPVIRLVPEHTLENADPTALLIQHYVERISGAHRAHQAEIDIFRERLRGNTMAGANPRFDAAFLARFLGEAPWNYRLLDVEAYAAGCFGWPEPLGLSATAEKLRPYHPIDYPDHSAAADVAVARQIYEYCQRYQSSLGTTFLSEPR